MGLMRFRVRLSEQVICNDFGRLCSLARSHLDGIYILMIFDRPGCYFSDENGFAGLTVLRRVFEM